ncbi:beta-galactosidase [Paenibacillus luteus]|uniref:beta-galactosidase n=1 Tax=Paenibacillus luteus TaxID=2545753 RepID=UPI001141C909|nr:beta-galactosidase [Paenibacillus luteus]
MRVGVAYYPEHWDEAYWELDAKKMQEIGVSIVRLAEFSWSRMEPEEDVFTFDWLDRAIDIMFRHGIEIVLGTPTSAPPNWFMEKYPDAYILDDRLQPRYEGIRGHRCVNSPSLAKRSVVIVEQMAQRYAVHPAIIGWQIDNEFELSLCNCPNCEREFREWAFKKFDSLEVLNNAWGTVVWSGEYSNWSQLHTPRGGKRQLNPAFQLDYHRFQNQSLAAYQQLQIEILRRHCPGKFVTHNMWEDPLAIDYYKLFEPLDFAGTDYYIASNPEQLPTSAYNGAYYLDQARGLKQQNFWIMETNSGFGNSCWGPARRTMPPGFLRAVMWQCISRGADVVMNYLWRGSMSGSEQLSSGIMGHANQPSTRRLVEYTQICGEINRLSDSLDGTTLNNDIEIFYSHEIHRALQIQPQIKDGLNYDKIQKFYHTAFNNLGVGTDVIHWNSNKLNSYKLIVAPYLFLMNHEMVYRLEGFVSAGGTLVLTNRSGIKDMNNNVSPTLAPGLLANIAGLTVEEWDAIGQDGQHQVMSRNGRIYKITDWADIIAPTSASPIAWYNNDYFAGRAAVTVNNLGKGKVYYIGANFELDYLIELFGQIVDDLKITRIPNLPNGVHASIRRKATKFYLFLINFTDERKTIVLEHACYSLFDGPIPMGPLNLPPFGVEILCEGTE